MMNDCLFYCLDECLRPLSARLKHVLTEISFLCPLFCAVNSPLIDLEEEIGVPAIEMWLYTVSLSSLLLSSSRPDILLTQHFKEDLSRYNNALRLRLADDGDTLHKAEKLRCIVYTCLSFLLHRWLTSARLQKDSRTDLYDQLACQVDNLLADASLYRKLMDEFAQSAVKEKAKGYQSTPLTPEHLFLIVTEALKRAEEVESAVAITALRAELAALCTENTVALCTENTVALCAENTASSAENTALCAENTVALCAEKTVVSSAENREADTEQDVNSKKFSINQILMLFEGWVDVPLDSSHVNQCAIARLVNRISGWSEESVRVRVANGVNYSGPQGRRDVKLVSSMLDEVNPLYADRIRGNI